MLVNSPSIAANPCVGVGKTATGGPFVDGDDPTAPYDFAMSPYIMFPGLFVRAGNVPPRLSVVPSEYVTVVYPGPPSTTPVIVLFCPLVALVVE